MKLVYCLQLLTLATLICITAGLNAQTKIVITGTVTDESSGEPLPGATVLLKNTITGSITGADGKYSLEVAPEKERVIVVSYVGYETKELPVPASQSNFNVALRVNLVQAKEAVVTASRVSETILEAPVSIIKMNALDIKETPRENFYAGLANFKGIDIITGGLLYQTINTRGFNDLTNSRVIQLIDGIDNSAPGIGRPTSNLLGSTDIDLERVEVVPGTASALYGANAFNGLINMITKDPFTYPGLSVQLKAGMNHVDGKYHDPAVYNDVQLRYARLISKRFGFKITAGYIRGTDWIVADNSDLNPGVISGINNPGRNLNNVYGDEVAGPLPIGPNGSPVVVSRTGYDRTVLMDEISNSLKAGVSLYYKLKNGMQLSYALQYGRGAVSYDVYALKNVWQISNKLELRGNNFTARAYYTHDEGGDAYNALLGVIKMNNANPETSDSAWFGNYYAAYSGFIPTVAAGDHNLARTFANSAMLVPGTEAFIQAWSRIKSIPIGNGGAQFLDRSSRVHGEAQYDFSSMLKVVDVIAGGTFRQTMFNSNGTVLIDEPGKPINVNEFAGYLQAGKELLNKHLKVTGSVRYDGSDNFKGEFTPRAALVIKPDDKNFIRASYQSGFRIPDPLFQYQNIDLGYQRLIGFLPAVNTLYPVHNLAFTAQSVTDFGNAAGAYIAANGPASAPQAVELYKGLLKKEPWDFIQPEHVKTYEVGYQRLFSNALYVDVAYFHNEYSGLHVAENIIKTNAGGPQNGDSLTAAGFAILAGNLSLYQVGVNSLDKAASDGVEAGISIVLPRNYVLAANFTYTTSNVTRDKDLPGFRTPRYKTNVSFSNRNAYKNFGFAVNWRWVDAISTWTNVAASAKSVDNNLPANSVVDLQLNYRVKKTGITFKLGGANIINNYYQDQATGPAVGGLYYISFLYEGEL